MENIYKKEGKITKRAVREYSIIDGWEKTEKNHLKNSERQLPDSTKLPHRNHRTL